MKHRAFVNQLFYQPGRIEHHFRSILKEFSLGHGRIDLIGRDLNGVLCLVEVKTKDGELAFAQRQIQKYRNELIKFLAIAGIKLSIRALLVTPNKTIDIGVKTSKPPLVSISTEIPTSREVFGLKGDVKNAASN